MGFGNDFLICHLSKNKQVGLQKTKKLIQSKRNNQQSKKTTMEWGKNICEQISDKGLLPKIYEELTQLNSQKIPPKQKNLNEKTQVIQLQDGQKT